MSIVPTNLLHRRHAAAPACAGMPVSTFYEREHLKTALKTCGTCPIRMACLQDELSRPITHQHGVRGGLIAARRQEIIRSWRIAAVVELSARPVVVAPTTSAVAA